LPGTAYHQRHITANLQKHKLNTMKNNPSFKKQESAVLRFHLETCLVGIFTGEIINEYLVAYSIRSDFSLFPVNINQATNLPQIKLAYAIWLGMRAADRHAVLAKFQCLYAALPAGAVSGQTLTFCTVFIHELAGALAKAMQWPD
jgi:hypothetical protein